MDVITYPSPNPDATSSMFMPMAVCKDIFKAIFFNENA